MARPPTPAELRELIAQRRGEPDLSRLPYPEQQEVILDRDHPLRQAMRVRDRRIREGLAHHALTEADLDLG